MQLTTQRGLMCFEPEDQIVLVVTLNRVEHRFEVAHAELEEHPIGSLQHYADEMARDLVSARLEINGARP
jgi:hypothetical protein